MYIYIYIYTYSRIHRTPEASKPLAERSRILKPLNCFCVNKKQKQINNEQQTT